MNTDTIPEAREAADNWHNRLGKPTTTLPLLITQACLSYHKRKLAECVDAKTLEKQLNKIADNLSEFYGRDGLPDKKVVRVSKALKLLQLHTAKAVEEATKADDDFIKKVTIKAYEIPNPCSNPGDAVLYALNEAATLQKQCEELRHDRDNWKKASECEHADKEDLRTRAEKAEAEVAELKKEQEILVGKLRNERRYQGELTAQLSTLQQDVEKLQWDLGICSTCGGEIFHHIDEPFYDCQKCGQHGEATVLPKLQKARCELINFQRDVRPLLSHINECEGDGGCRATKALETFLSKHPELGPNP